MLIWTAAGKGKNKIAIGIVGVVGYLGCVVLTALTYSRGAWCALLVTLLCLLVILRVRFAYGIAFIGATMAMFCCVPKGVLRVASIGDVRSDKAISNRLDLWRGTCHISAAHPLGGVGAGNIGIAYQKYWQPFGEGHCYKSAVNLPLTLLAEHGLGVFALYVLGTLLAVRFSCLLFKKERNWFFAWAFSLFLCFSIANLFATITDRIIVYPLLCMAAIVLYFVIVRLRMSELTKHWVSWLTTCLVLLVLPFAVSLLVGKPIEIDVWPMPDSCSDVYAEHISPAGCGGGNRVCAMIWCAANDEDSVVRGARLGRLASAAGVEALVVRCGKTNALETMAKNLTELFVKGRPVLVCADGPLVAELHRILTSNAACASI